MSDKTDIAELRDELYALNQRLQRQIDDLSIELRRYEGAYEAHIKIEHPFAHAPMPQSLRA